MCWRGVTNYTLPKKYKNELNEAWGKGDRFGFVQIADNKTYWYALKTFKTKKEEFSVNEIETYFKTYHPIIRNIIGSTPKEQIHTSEISDLQPTKLWQKGNICLVGDAAHATTPNMGQGACQAIEDAYILTECLSKYEVKEAFKKFQKIRLEKAHKVVKVSWTIGKIAHLSNPISIVLRNQIMKLTPEKIIRKQSEHFFQLATV